MNREQDALCVADLNFNEDGLLAAIIQDVDSKEVLMMAWMNLEALQKSVESGFVWLWSRSRQSLWQKGESSGNIQTIKSIAYDCDADTLLLQVIQSGDGVACHTGARTCFYRKLEEYDG